MNHKIIKEIEAEQMRTDLPNYTPGDTVVIHVEFMEGTRKRIQPFEGIVLAVKNRGLNSSITVRKISQGEGVERVFSVHSPSVNKIEIKRRGKVNRAKIYYLRDLKGRAARIPEDLKQARKDRAIAQAEKSAGA